MGAQPFVGGWGFVRKRRGSGKFMSREGGRQSLSPESAGGWGAVADGPGGGHPAANPGRGSPVLVATGPVPGRCRACVAPIDGTSDRGGGPCDRISTTSRAFEVMSRRRRGYPERDARQ